MPWADISRREQALWCPDASGRVVNTGRTHVIRTETLVTCPPGQSFNGEECVAQPPAAPSRPPPRAPTARVPPAPKPAPKAAIVQGDHAPAKPANTALPATGAVQPAPPKAAPPAPAVDALKLSPANQKLLDEDLRCLAFAALRLQSDNRRNDVKDAKIAKEESTDFKAMYLWDITSLKIGDPQAKAKEAAYLANYEKSWNGADKSKRVDIFVKDNAFCHNGAFVERYADTMINIQDAVEDSKKPARRK